MFKLIAAAGALIAASALVLPTVGHAQEVNSVTVTYADLNLASKVAQGTLHRRITGAAKIVCVIEDSREIALSRATNACRNDAIARAQPAYDAAVAAARHGTVNVIESATLAVTAN